MSLVDGSESSRRGRFYCQLYQTYLPPSHLPASCRDTVETYPQWAWALVNTVFVSATTVFNVTVILAVVFLWMVNRQFHFKNKHSYDKKPLRPLKKPAKVLRSASNSLKNAAKRIRKRKKKVEVEHSEEERRTLSEQNKYKSFQSFLEDFDEEDEDDEAIDKALANDIRKRGGLGVPGGSDVNLAGAETRAKSAKTKRKKDLLHLASKIEVFSYLSPEALADILEYVEYVDFQDVGRVVYDTDTLDGSMYAVVSGEVTTSISIRDNTGDNGSTVGTGSKSKFSFVAAPGEVITSLLSIITSLIREYQLQDALLYSLIPGVLSDGTGIGGQHVTGSRKTVVPHDMIVKAVVSSPDTRLLRIPSRCFVAILEKYPRDVHNITQTIVARLQRVTIQTLVRFLGLDEGIIGISGPRVATSSAIPEKNPHNLTTEWRKFEQHLAGQSSTTLPTSVLDQAVSAAASLLGLSQDNSQELRAGAEIVLAPPGSIICRKGQAPDSIHLILKGNLEVGLEKDTTLNVLSSGNQMQNGVHKKATRTKRASFVESNHGGQHHIDTFKPLFSAAAGNWVGLFSCFTHDASFITIRNPEGASSAILLKIPSRTFEKVVSTYPRALIHCLLDIIDTVGDGANLCVSPAMFLLDMSLDWMHAEAGEYIAIKGEPCDSMYVVLNGRLCAEPSSDSDKGQRTHEEYGRGATIGEVEALAGGSWANSFFAIRHVEVARIPVRVINILMEMFPSAGMHFARIIASQVHSRKGAMKLVNAPSLLPSFALSLATTAVVPLTEDVDVSEFCAYLTNSFASVAPTKLLTKEKVKDLVGDKFFQHRNAMLKVKITRLLGDFEENNRLVLYEADAKYTWWTKLCIQQADCVLILVDSRTAPKLKRVEECLAWANEAKNVRIELVAIQSVSAQEEAHGGGDIDALHDWSEQRAWISKHHIIRRSFSDNVNDFRRLTRRITGQSIGIVLGGGGARGLAHLGIIKALNEVGVPLDMVGGTSQGAFVGALLARNPDDFELLSDSVHEMALGMSSISNKLRDLTFPLTSFFSGHHFNKAIQRVLGNIRIQDFVLSFFCISVDISNCRQMVHSKGLAWKYVRASMGLTGYLPPISENDSLLVDGGYMNVVPADVMADMGAKKVIAVDVSKEEKSHFYEYGTELSGLWLLWNSWNPFVQTVKVPSMGDITERLSWVSSERMKKDIIENKVDLFLRPPVGHIGTLEFDKIDEIVQIGYDYAKPLIEEWAEENGLE